MNPNAYVYCANGPTNFVDPSGQEGEHVIHWHHMFDQAIFTPEFLARHQIELDIHDKSYGWMLAGKNHVFEGGIHCAGWSDDWKAWIKAQEDAGIRITKEMLEDRLNTMKTTTFKKYFDDSVGQQADMSYKTWEQGPKARLEFRKEQKAAEAAAEAGTDATGTAARAGGDIAEDVAGKAAKKGGKRVAKKLIGAIPVVGLFLDIMMFPGQVRAKGLVGAACNTAVDNVPFVEWGKTAIELQTGLDMIPDKDDDDSFWDRTQRILESLAESFDSFAAAVVPHYDGGGFK